MSYEGLTFDTFMSKLKAGEYVAIAGARRAVGRMKWPKAQLATAKEAIDKYFKVSGGEKTAAPKGKPGPKPKAKTAEAVPVKAKPGPKPGGARRGRPPKALQQPAKSIAADAGSDADFTTVKHAAPAAPSRLELVDARDLNNSIASLLDAYANVKRVDPSINMSDLQLIVDTAAVNVKRHIRPYIVGAETESTEKFGKAESAVRAPKASTKTVTEQVTEAAAPKRRIVETAPVKATVSVGTVESPKAVVAPVLEEADEDEDDLLHGLDEDEETPAEAAASDEKTDDDEEELDPAKLRLTNSWRNAAGVPAKD